MDGELSPLDKIRIYEYQQALKDGIKEEIEDAETALRALSLDPILARDFIFTREELYAIEESD